MKTSNLLKTLVPLLYLCLTHSMSLAQTDSLQATSRKNTLTVGAIYANNASYYGQKATEPTPYAAVVAMYQLSSGIYFTGQSYRLIKDNTTTLSAGSLGAGLAFNMGRKFGGDLSYSHSFYPAYSPLLQAANADNASFSVSGDSLWIKPKLTLDYAFGKTSDAFATAGISKSVSLFSITNKDVITIEPEINVVGGTQHFYRTYLTGQKLRDSLLGLPIPVLGSSGTSHTDTLSTTNFNLLSYNFQIPLAYNRAHYLLEAAYQVSLLSNHVAAAEKINSFLTFSFYYQF